MNFQTNPTACAKRNNFKWIFVVAFLFIFQQHKAQTYNSLNEVYQASLAVGFTPGIKNFNIGGNAFSTYVVVLS